MTANNGYGVLGIENINNTREGIVMFIQAKKGNALSKKFKC